MNIDKNSVVTFHYTLRNAQGEELESSRDGDPSAYLHGAGNILPGIESALEGEAAGKHLEVSLESADAYGERRDDAVQKVPVKHLSHRGRLRPGVIAQLNTNQGRIPVTVTKVGRHSATVDTNHPLAGMTLNFEIDVLEVRAASQEEIEHGHVHGVGGHQH